MRVAIPTNVDDNFSIADVDLQRHGSIVALGDTIAESANKAAHRTYPSFAFASIFMKPFDCSVVAFQATAANFQRGVDFSLVPL